MRRDRSKLAVLIRLARLEEDQALQKLGRARQVVERLESGLAELTSLVEGTRIASVLPPGTRRVASELASAADRAVVLQLRRAALYSQRSGALQQEGSAREAVVQTKLKLRALRRAEARREARERLHARRREVRRLDELQRGRTLREEYA